MPFTESKMDASRIAKNREALGGGVLSARIASRAALFQSVTTSARAARVTPSAVSAMAAIKVCVFIGFEVRGSSNGFVAATAGSAVGEICVEEAWLHTYSSLH